MADFVKRLLRVQKKGRLSVADIQHWFDRPYPTVRQWIINKREPRETGSGAYFSSYLKALEKCVDSGKFDALMGISSYERPGRIRELRRKFTSGDGISKKDRS